MKKLLLTSLLTLGLPAALALADVAVYSGGAVLKQTSEVASGTTTVKLIEIVDLATNTVTTVTLSKGKLKTYQVGQPVSFTKASVQDARNRKTYTVLARALTSGDAAAPVIDTLVLKGQDGSFSINKGAGKVTLPKKLQGGGVLLSTAAPASLTEAMAVLSLDEKLSRASNEAAVNPGTVETALELVKQAIEAQGYTAVTAP